MQNSQTDDLSYFTKIKQNFNFSNNKDNNFHYINNFLKQNPYNFPAHNLYNLFLNTINSNLSNKQIEESIIDCKYIIETFHDLAINYMDEKTYNKQRYLFFNDFRKKYFLFTFHYFNFGFSKKISDDLNNPDYLSKEKIDKIFYIFDQLNAFLDLKNLQENNNNFKIKYSICNDKKNYIIKEINERLIKSNNNGELLCYFLLNNFSLIDIVNHSKFNLFINDKQILSNYLKFKKKDINDDILFLDIKLKKNIFNFLTESKQLISEFFSTPDGFLLNLIKYYHNDNIYSFDHLPLKTFLSSISKNHSYDTLSTLDIHKNKIIGLETFSHIYLNDNKYVDVFESIIKHYKLDQFLLLNSTYSIQKEKLSISTNLNSLVEKKFEINKKILKI